MSFLLSAILLNSLWSEVASVMGLADQFRLMSEYNLWMNDKLYKNAAELGESIIKQDKGAFFKSIFGTLNHIMVGDIAWLRRFAKHPVGYQSLEPIKAIAAPKQLDMLLYDNLSELTQQRQKLDCLIIDWCEEIKESDLEKPLTYSNLRGEPATRLFGSLILHFFNHQTHHRGQITTLLSQEMSDLGATDFIGVVPKV